MAKDEIALRLCSSYSSI